VPHRHRRMAPSMSKRSLIVVLLLGLLLVALSTIALGQQSPHERGRTLVERECAKCHAVSTTGVSRHPKAPPFRELHKKYPIEQLAESLAEGIVVGHKDMPEFLFEPEDVEAILTYISSLGGR
jgi:cytochrome c